MAAADNIDQLMKKESNVLTGSHVAFRYYHLCLEDTVCQENHMSSEY